MKILLSMILLCVFLNADMCKLYTEKLGSTFKKMERAKKYKLMDEFKRMDTDIKYYSEKLIVNCEENSKIFKVALNILDSYK